MTLLELLPSQSGDVRRSPGISSRRISSANKGGISGNQTFDLVGMDSSLVVSAGSQCCPGGDLSICCVESQGVLGLDLNHIAPSQEFLGEWISDDHALISDLQHRTMHDQVNESSNNCCGNQSQNDVRDIGGYEGLKNSSSKQGVSNVGHHNCGCGSETFDVRQSELSTGERGI